MKRDEFREMVRDTAEGLLSEHGENPEYDRAIVEFAADLGVTIDDHGPTMSWSRQQQCWLWDNGTPVQGAVLRPEELVRPSTDEGCTACNFVGREYDPAKHDSENCWATDDSEPDSTVGRCLAKHHPIDHVEGKGCVNWQPNTEPTAQAERDGVKIEWPENQDQYGPSDCTWYDYQQGTTKTYSGSQWMKNVYCSGRIAEVTMKAPWLGAPKSSALMCEAHVNAYENPYH